MGYSNRTIVKSTKLAGQQNGKLPDSILVTIAPLSGVGGANVRLIEPASRGFKALRGEGAKLGHMFKPTSAFDSYRPYAVQLSTFTSRYSKTRPAGSPGSKVWNGVRWYQKPGTAMAAVPGTSNHGWAAAVDVGEERDSDSSAESLDNATLSWLLNNEERFGFFHSVGPSEPWHIDWFPGDAIPAAVLEWERSQGTGPRMEDDMDIFLRGEKGEIAIMSANTTRGIADMRTLALNLKVRGITNPSYQPVAMADVRAGAYGPEITSLDDAVRLSADAEKRLAELVSARTAEEIAAMSHDEITAHVEA